jgi:predicted HicB family RNase H-like nuclease
MKDLMKYKAYFGSVHDDDNDRVFHGKVKFIRALVSYEGTDVAFLRKAFEEAVDDYLEICLRRKTIP